MVSRISVAFFLVLLGSPLVAQPGDSQAIALVTQSVAAMGGTAPPDSVANGTVNTTTGGQTDSGTVRILTRGVDQSSLEYMTGSLNQREVYSQGSGSDVTVNGVTPQSLEFSSTSQACEFPLPLLLGAQQNPDTVFQYVGLETVNGVAAQHVRFWNSYASIAALQPLAEFGVRDLWLDATTNLPVKFAFQRRAADGSVPAVAIEVVLSNYQNVNGILYPFSIEKVVSGNLWAIITIQSVTFNNGLTDADFPIS